MYETLAKTPLVRSLIRRYARTRSPIYFISFPKCGRTWIRVMLGRVIQQHYGLEEKGLLDLVEPRHRRPGFPGIKWVHDDSVHWKRPEELSENKDRYRFRKVIFLVRDPRDVVTSLYFEKHNRLPAYVEGERKQYPEVAHRIEPFPGDLSSYLSQEVGGLDTILRFYRIWEANRGVPEDFLLVRYEDLHHDTAAQLGRIVDFVGLGQVDPGVLFEAAEYARFERMRRMEEKNQLGSTSLRPADAGDPESFKTRKGKVGGYVEYLSDEETARLTRRMEQVLGGLFGYGAG
jgi:hypothetical protein